MQSSSEGVAPLPADDDLFIPPHPVFSPDLFGVDALMGKAEPKRTDLERVVDLCAERGWVMALYPPGVVNPDTGYADDRWRCVAGGSGGAWLVDVTGDDMSAALHGVLAHLESPGPEMRWLSVSDEFDTYLRILKREAGGLKIPEESLVEMAAASREMTRLLDEVVGDA